MDHQSHSSTQEQAPSFIFGDLSASTFQWNDTNEGCFSNCNLWGGIITNNKSITNEDAAKGSNTEKEEVDKFLAESMKKLSLEEKEKALEEVRGILPRKDHIDEDSAFMDAIMKRLETHLLLIKRGSSYERAEQMNKAYVSNRPFRILFLRSNQYDPKPSAEHMIRYFEIKEELFGTHKLVQEILIEDLDPSDINCLESGAGQLLPHPDRANRRVFLMMPGLRRLCPVEHQLRSNFYVIMTTLRESDEARRHGVVAIIYTVGRFRDMSAGLDAARFAKVASSLPIPFCGMHFCHSDIRQFVLVKALLPLMPLYATPKFRSHYGTHAEVLYALRGYGISEDVLPFSHFEDKFLLRHHNMWCQDRKQKDAIIAIERRALLVLDCPPGPYNAEEAVSTALNHDDKGSHELIASKAVFDESAQESDDGRLNPCPQDILFGYGYKLHPGNVQLHNLIGDHADDYAAIDGKKEKMDYALNLVRYMKNQGSRFLIFERESKGWVEVSDNQARNKVAKTIRNRRRK
ncbi:unnamed protein product [Cylindrotheca closterium]|uniref:DUF6824 domain-containing protein n=1 Tax=Cylindrotheca closterium TaxID=2856 RepID=A0AAD2JJK7_9STRA|nr:unnamed protein product [Cylindrotheca closterium]